jgi:hypothetical protein
MRRSLSRTARALIMIAVMATGVLLGYTTASQLGWVHWQRIPFQLLAHDLFMGPSTTSHPGAPELYVIASSADVERIIADVLNIPPGLDEQRPGFVTALRGSTLPTRR